ncbi:hypothetical protein D0809_13920 [Flavobacterium circumlabens]|uniref:Uncharacterized protein n=1 Tax=Flavobacterium circumlabens TaxID=2133765 RepID=A0A4Y7UC17_9FLAO|nr:hypothetical protein [Flavobacterium circumlabens]TCN57679.1 hypothetical protein EV142_104341 [Flavobacterium circumlabens]TEB43980.1 hypothetical protein D0809_13920 [Flavobacterium circumlabens]
MKNKLLVVVFLLVGMISYSQEHYYEVGKLYVKKADGTSSVEKHEIAVLLNEEAKTCSVRIDYKEPQIFKIVSENKDPQTTVKTYELLHDDGRKITVSIKKKRMTVVAHTTGTKFETDINYSKSEK